MAEITMNDLKNTYVKLKKDVQVFSHPSNGDKGKPVWFTKKRGEIAGKVFMWITPGADLGFTGIQNSYLVFKINDDFYNEGAYWYFIKYEKNMIDWEFTKTQLQQKAYLDMNVFEKFVVGREDRWNEVVDYAQSGLFLGGALALIILYWNTVGKYQVQAKMYQSVLRTTVKELKK